MTFLHILMAVIGAILTLALVIGCFDFFIFIAFWFVGAACIISFLDWIIK